VTINQSALSEKVSGTLALHAMYEKYKNNHREIPQTAFWRLRLMSDLARSHRSRHRINGDDRSTRSQKTPTEIRLKEIRLNFPTASPRCTRPLVGRRDAPIVPSPLLLPPLLARAPAVPPHESRAAAGHPRVFLRTGDRLSVHRRPVSLRGDRSAHTVPRDGLLPPLRTPVSFLLVYRHGRAAPGTPAPSPDRPYT